MKGDFSWTGIDGSQTYNPIPPGPTGGFATPPSFVTMSRDVKWLASVRGRLGYAWDRALIFATGGVAWSHTDYLGIDSRGGGGTVDTASLSSTKGGWVVGGGLEYGLIPNWTLRGEYLYYSTLGVSAIAVQNPVCAPLVVEKNIIGIEPKPTSRASLSTTGSIGARGRSPEKGRSSPDTDPIQFDADLTPERSAGEPVGQHWQHQQPQGPILDALVNLPCRPGHTRKYAAVRNRTLAPVPPC